MRSWRNNLHAVAVGAVSVASIAYPLGFYFWRDRVSSLVFVGVAVLLVAARAATLKRSQAKMWLRPMIGVAVMLSALALLDRAFAAQAYPVLLSLAAAILFAWSLLSPPSLIEKFARISSPNLPHGAEAYCRAVTAIWATWFFLNAFTAAGLARWGSVKLWAIWTGGVFYAVTGLLILGEFGIRRLMLRNRGER